MGYASSGGGSGGGYSAFRQNPIIVAILPLLPSHTQSLIYILDIQIPRIPMQVFAAEPVFVH